MKLILLALFLTQAILAQSWVTVTQVNPPGNNDFGGATYNRWLQKGGGWWRAASTANSIYSDALLVFDQPSSTWTQLNFNNSLNANDCGAADTATEPGSGHPGNSHVYDWLHDLWFLHNRVSCGANVTSLYSYLDNKDNPSNGWWTGGPWHRQLATSTPPRWDGNMTFDPINNVVWEFGGLVNQSVDNTISSYTYSTNTLTTVTPANTPPTARAAVGSWFDYWYSDSHPGEARIGYYAGYFGAGTAETDGVNYWYPNGSASLGLAANSWQVNVGSGGPTAIYGWVVAYDTLRDLVWMYSSTTQVAAWNPATSTWAYYNASGANNQCPRNDCNMYYDEANDKLVLTVGNPFVVQTLDLQTVISKTRGSCGPGFYKTNASGTYVARGMAFPTYLSQYTDPLGGCVTRVTAVTDGSASAYSVPLYSQVDPVDSSQRLMFLVDGRVLDITNNYRALPSINLWSTFRSTGAIWTRNTPLTMNGMDANTTAIFKKCTIAITGSGVTEDGSLSCTTIKDMSAQYQTCAGNGVPARGYGSQMVQVSQQNRDINDSYVVLTCQKQPSGTSQIVMVLLNTQTGVTGVEFNIAPPTPIGGCSPAFGPNFAWVGYKAQYVLVDWGLPNTGNNRLCGLESYNLANAASPTGSWTFVGQVVPDSAHGDLMIGPDNKEYFVAFASNTAWSPFTGTITRCVVPDGFSQVNHAGCASVLNAPYGGGHITAHAFGRIGEANPFFLWDRDNAPNSVDIAWGPCTIGICKVYWDSTPGVPHMEQIAHTYSDQNWFIACPSCVSSSYWSQAKTTLSWDGTKAWFASSWGPRDGTDTFVITSLAAPFQPPNGSIISGNVSFGGPAVLK